MPRKCESLLGVLGCWTERALSCTYCTKCESNSTRTSCVKINELSVRRNKRADDSKDYGSFLIVP